MRLPGICVALLVILTSSVPVSAQLKLAWKLEKGQKFYQETTTQLKQTTKIKGQELAQELEYVTVTSFVVKDRAADGSVVLEQKIESIRTGGKSAPSTDVVNLLNGLQGATFEITLSPAFKITKFDGYDELIKRLGGDDPARTRVAQTLLARETLQSSVEEAFALLPEEPVKPGQTWERKLTTSLGPLGAVIGTYTYTHEKPDQLDGKALQRISITAQLGYQSPRDDPGLLPFRISKGDLRVQAGKGTCWFDEKLGRLVQSEMSLHIRGTLTYSAAGHDATVELDRDQTVKIRITDEMPMSR